MSPSSRFTSMSQFIGYSIVQSSCRASIPDMDQCSKCLPPECHGESWLLEHGSDALWKDLISTFCYPILLWLCSGSVLVLDTTLGGELEHDIAHILPSLIIAQCFDLLLALVLCKCLKLLKSVEYVWFGTNGQNEVISQIVINESDPIAISRECRVGHLMDIRMH